MLGNNIVGVYHVAVALAHLAAILGQDKAQELQARKRLYGRDDAQVVQKLVPEACIYKVAHRVVAAHIYIYWCPVLLHLSVDKRRCVVRVHKAQVIPGAAGPLWHGVCLALGRA